MSDLENPDVLVICSTLNQITNYLMIKKFQPKKIINITLEEKEDEKTGINIKNKKWNEYLKETIKGKYNDWIDIRLTFNELKSIKKISKVLIKGNKNGKQHVDILNDKDKEVYWHITGGQRTIALAIQKFILANNRNDDKILYIEGNSEKLLLQSLDAYCGLEEYGDEDLALETAFKLVGFQNFNVDEKNLLTDYSEKESEIFLKLYNLITEKGVMFEVNGNELNLRNHLIEANKGELKSEGRKEYLVKFFNKLGRMGHLNKNQVNYLTEYKIKKSKEDGKQVEKKKYELINGSYPAGTVFEKIVGYKMLKIIKDGNYNIVDMRMNCKIKFDKATKDENDSNQQIDEMDIILLTATGQIIVFECKSGGMSGDNAKSHKYTTYRLAGVFGAPIFLSPLFDEEINLKEIKKGDRLYSCKGAYNSACRAELEIWKFDKLECKFEKFMKKYEEEGDK